MSCSSDFYSYYWLFIKSASLPITAGVCLLSPMGLANAVQEESFSDGQRGLDNNISLSFSGFTLADYSAQVNSGHEHLKVRCGLDCIDTFSPQFSHGTMATSAINFSADGGFISKLSDGETKGKKSDSKEKAAVKVQHEGSDDHGKADRPQPFTLSEGLTIPWSFSSGNLESSVPTIQPAVSENWDLDLSQLVAFTPFFDNDSGETTVVEGAIAQTVGIPYPPNGTGGIPVPWQFSQNPAAAPTAFPAAPVAGNWMMVWIPYGAPAAPTSPNGTFQGNNTPSQPNYYPAWIPVAALNQGLPGGGSNPGLAPTQAPGMIPGSVPWGTGLGYAPTAPSPSYPATVPYGWPNTAPQPYGVAAQIPGIPHSPTAGQFPAASGYPGYAVPPANIGTGQMLPVPTLPSPAPLNSTLPSPPAVNIPVPAAGISNGFNLPAVLPSTPSGFPGGAQTPPALPPAQPATPVSPVPAPTTVVPVETIREPLTEPSLEAQGLALVQDGEFSSRARLNGSAFLTPNLLVGGTVDFVNGPNLTNDDGLQITELYVAGSVPGAPGLRFRVGQLDLTSYFDRNSFAKDISRDFFNDTFQTNPALFAGANVTASRPAALAQWAVNDDVTLTASAFSSDADISNFDLNGFAGEASVRTGNLIVRGTFLSSEDTDFQGTGERLEAYGVNAEWFVPSWNIGFFGRYGFVNNTATDFDDDTFSIGLNALDVFMDKDRLGLAYGNNLDISTDDDTNPDVLEVFYDFEIRPNLRAGFSFQQRDSLSESFLGFRIRGNLGILP